MGDQPVTSAYLEVITTALTILTEQMANFSNKVNNTTNNENQQRDRGEEHVRVPQCVNNHRVVSSFVR